MPRPMQIVAAAALAAGLLKLAITPFLDMVAPGLAIGVLFLACGAVLRRRWSAVALAGAALLFALELSGLPLYERDSAFDWIAQATGTVIWLSGLAAVAAAVLERRRRAAAISA